VSNQRPGVSNQRPGVSNQRPGVSKRSVKYEDVYLRACESVSEARAGLGRYFEFSNAKRPRSSPGRMTPDQFYNKLLTARAAA
jgi:putative transposase